MTVLLHAIWKWSDALRKCAASQWEIARQGPHGEHVPTTALASTGPSEHWVMGVWIPRIGPICFRFNMILFYIILVCDNINAWNVTNKVLYMVKPFVEFVNVGNGDVW